MKNHFVKLFQYNLWRHQSIYQFLCNLNKPEEFLFRDFSCLYFNTPAATIDHLLLADELWQMRLLKLTTNKQYQQLSSYWKPGNKLKFSEHWRKQSWLRHYREDTYRTMNNFIEIINSHPKDQDLLVEKLEYPDSQGNKKQRVLSDVLTHLINHHTHHIGQISAASKEYSKMDDFPSTDYTYFLD